MTEEAFKHDFRVFRRILKEYGVYSLVMRYIFSGGRTVEDFKKSVDKLHGFAIALKTQEGIGAENYHRFGGYEYWHENISDVARAVYQHFMYGKKIT